LCNCVGTSDIDNHYHSVGETELPSSDEMVTARQLQGSCAGACMNGRVVLNKRAQNHDMILCWRYKAYHGMNGEIFCHIGSNPREGWCQDQD